MTTIAIDRSVVKQALEALKLSTPQPRPTDDDYSELGWKEHNAAITALKAALAQEQVEPVQEPVAWRYKPMIGSPWSLSDDGYYISCKRDKGYTVEPLYTAPPRCPNCASLEAQNTELDRKLAEMEQVIEKLRKEILKE